MSRRYAEPDAEAQPRLGPRQQLPARPCCRVSRGGEQGDRRPRHEQAKGKLLYYFRRQVSCLGH